VRILKTDDPLFFPWLEEVKGRGESIETQVEDAVREVLREVKTKGDRALLEYTRRWDGFDVSSPEDLVISKEDMEAAYFSLPAELQDALQEAHRRIKAFHEAQKEQSWFLCESGGTILGQKVTPLDKVGVYVPGGRASYPSSLLMNVIPAKVAGVKEVVVCSPTPQGKVNKALLGAGYLAGVDRIYRVGGAQAVAAMAYGTSLIPAVDKIVGPGNVYVATAKRLVFGVVDIDTIAGPSEILILAEDGAPPRYVAADLLSQAEHDTLASAILVTPSYPLAQEVAKEVEILLEDLPTAPTARQSLNRYGGVVVCSSLEEGVELVNQIAPEHLEIFTKDPWKVLPLIRHAGAIFLGPYSPEPMGDYIAGPNHVLPTGGRARFSSPLCTKDFLKYSSIISLERETFDALKRQAITLAQWEGLPAHAKSLEVRK